MTDPDKLREAIRLAGQYADIVESGQGFPGLPSAESMRLLARAAESTLPKTKMVEVWRVESAHEGCPCLSQYTNEQDARGWERSPPSCYACIRVTGPHMQEVPA